MTTSVKFLFIIVPFKLLFIACKVDIISMKMHCFHGRRHDFTSSRLKCYVTCGRLRNEFLTCFSMNYRDFSVK